MQPSRASLANVELARTINHSIPEVEECIRRLLKNGMGEDIVELRIVVPLLREAAARLLLPIKGVGD